MCWFLLLSLFVTVNFDLEACAIEGFRFNKIDRLVDSRRGLMVMVVMMVWCRTVCHRVNLHFPSEKCKLLTEPAVPY